MCIDDANADTLAAWLALKESLDEANRNLNNGLGAVDTALLNLGDAVTDVSDALDAAEKAKVKSDKNTLHDAKDYKELFKALEKVEKELFGTATEKYDTAKGIRDAKDEELNNALIDLSGALEAGKQENFFILIHSTTFFSECLVDISRRYGETCDSGGKGSQVTKSTIQTKILSCLQERR